MTVTLNPSVERIRKHGCVSDSLSFKRQNAQHRNAHGGRRTIVVPFDFTPASEHALDHAISHARRAGDEIRMVHVLTQPYGYGLLEKRHKKEWQTGARENSEKKLRELVAAKDCQNVAITIEVRTGLPEYEILKATEASNAGLIVIGRKSRGALNRWVLGSVSENVLEGTRCPVLVLTTQS